MVTPDITATDGIDMKAFVLRYVDSTVLLSQCLRRRKDKHTEDRAIRHDISAGLERPTSLISIIKRVVHVSQQNGETHQ